MFSFSTVQTANITCIPLISTKIHVYISVKHFWQCRQRWWNGLHIAALTTIQYQVVPRFGSGFAHRNSISTGSLLNSIYQLRLNTFFTSRHFGFVPSVCVKTHRLPDIKLQYLGICFGFETEYSFFLNNPDNILTDKLVRQGGLERKNPLPLMGPVMNLSLAFPCWLQ